MAINLSDNHNEFNRVHAIEFHNTVLSNPEKYVWYDVDHHTLGGMCQKFQDAIPSGNFIISDIIKATCKNLGIKATYKSIREYIQ
jgi:regulator of sigma D